MSNRSNIEFVGKVKAEKLTSLAEDIKIDQAEIIADREHWAKYGTNKRNGASKREIKEELTRERFPWEE
ncbi:hypothetical protein [Polynucleobacter sp. MWH-Aus1W21]|uniref:hypothetical protein n=1 Tax=Polynucleobacter sp. MWH-Aus1W21 TaxID=1855880 RepID=UPI001BFE8B88|nr:hypothetical protein [Polynucleobacter sp. MWH-Aus1W21]QWD66021.1 hypothetical protein ICW03_10305 [Polynucleobacter sp. MWH-Aus1W21]